MPLTTLLTEGELTGNVCTLHSLLLGKVHIHHMDAFAHFVVHPD